MMVSPQTSYFEALTPGVVVLGNGTSNPLF